jgi:hypothetical protein
MNLINFSHPLSSEAEREIRERYAPGTDLHIYQIAVQLNLNMNLEMQAGTVFKQALQMETIRGNPMNVDMVILPGLNVAAVLLMRLFQRGGYTPHVLVMVNARDGSPPRWMPRHLIRGGGRRAGGAGEQPGRHRLG